MSDSDVAIVVPARSSSSRLPGKVLMPLAGAPAIVRMMERVARVTRARYHVVATSDHSSDDLLHATCREHGIPVARGSLDDVLGRVLEVTPAEFGTIVRLTGDCPLVEPALVDRHIELFLRERPWAEYVTNAVIRTQPDGLDVEVVTRDLLAQAGRQATAEADREHVLPWVRRRARTVPVAQEVDLSRLRWTLDTMADYDVITAIYDELYPLDPDFDSVDVYRLLVRRPELIRIEGRDRLGAAEQADWVARIQAHLRDVESGS